MLKPTSSLSLIGLKPTYLSLLSPLSYICISLVHDRVTSNPIFLFLSFASLTWYQSATRGEKNILGFPLRRRRPVLRRRHHQASSPCLLVGALPTSAQAPCCPATTPPSAVVALPPRRHRPTRRRLPCLLVVALPPCIQPPCCLRPAAVLLAPSRRGLLCPAVTPSRRRPASLHPAVVLFAPSRRPTCAQPSGTPSRPAVTRAVTLPAPSRQARRRAPLP